MIILDIETGGLDPARHALLSIGAVDYATGETFYIEARAFDVDELSDKALERNGFTVEQALDPAKPDRHTAYRAFLKWAKGRSTLIGGQQVGSFDVRFLTYIHEMIEDIESVYQTYNPELHNPIEPWPFGYRTVDLHSIVYAKSGQSLSLDGILQYVGLESEPKPHNALTGALREYEAFKRLLRKA